MANNTALLNSTKCMRLYLSADLTLTETPAPGNIRGKYYEITVPDGSESRIVAKEDVVEIEGFKDANGQAVGPHKAVFFVSVPIESQPTSKKPNQ